MLTTAATIAFDRARLQLLASKAYKGSVRPTRRRQRVSDEDLVAIFSALRDKWFEPGILKREIGMLVPINDDDPKRSVFGSNYIRRVSDLTGQRWRQKTGIGVDGKRLVGVFALSGRRRRTRNQRMR